MSTFTICILIFAARICDVSLKTIRIIYTVQKRKVLAPILAFIELLIWVVVFKELIETVGGTWCYLSYAGGYAVGTYIGIVMSEKLAKKYNLPENHI